LISIILPTSLLSYCENPFYVCYAEVAARDKTYLAFFKERRLKGSSVVLDYSPRLPRARVDFEVLVDIHRKLNPTSLVLPGVDYSDKKTIEWAQAFVRKYGKLVQSHWIGLLEGLDLESLDRCRKALISLTDVLGLPCSLEKIARREEIIRDLGITEPTLYLEVLGDPVAETPTGQSSLGICTSYPVRLAVDFRTFREHKPTPPSLDFGVSKVALDLGLVRSNIEEYLEAVNARSEGKPLGFL